MKRNFPHTYQITMTIFWIILLAVGTSQVVAQWSIDPLVNTAISTNSRDKREPAIVSDGSDGAIIAWEDRISEGDNNIYAQRIDKRGSWYWPVNGIGICTAPGDQNYMAIAGDGSGGAIITWEDHRGEYARVYAQRISADGSIQWTTDGRIVSLVSGDQTRPAIVGDGAGGAIITWEDHRNGAADIYAQRINSSGIAQWTSSGVPICTASGNQGNPVIVSDGIQGAIIAWEDDRSTPTDIYLQRINRLGAVQWTVNGIDIPGSDTKLNPAMISNGHYGGAIIAYEYTISEDSYIYVQRISSSGELLWHTYEWGATGIPVTYKVEVNEQTNPCLVSDGSGGTIVAWQDGSTIYAQRINTYGERTWSNEAIAVSTNDHGQFNQAIVSDGLGGAIVTWCDMRNGYADIYGQRINDSGVLQWKKKGVAICTAGDYQRTPALISDGDGGAIITWEDERNWTTYKGDIYAQKVGSHGYLGFANPVLSEVQDVPGDQGGKVMMTWYGSEYDIPSYQLVTHYSIWRGVDIPAVGKANGNMPHKRISADAANKDSSKGYRTIRIQGMETTWEWIADIPSHYMKTYSYTASTTSDSTANGIPYFRFFVSAQTDDPFVFWDSQSDFGYSVDNLPPMAPSNLKGEAVAGSAVLHWNSNSEDDLSGYAIYRGRSPDFDPDTMDVYATTGDTTYTDSKLPSSGSVYYVLRAEDIHDNQSPASNEVEIIITAVQDARSKGLPTKYALKQNYPNPFNPTTVIPYDLPAKSHVILKIYNVLGQQVATLVNADMKAGRYEARWNARGMPSGVYIYLLRAGSFMQSRKLILIK